MLLKLRRDGRERHAIDMSKIQFEDVMVVLVVAVDAIRGGWGMGVD